MGGWTPLYMFARKEDATATGTVFPRMTGVAAASKEV